MRTYTMGFLVKGPRWGIADEEDPALQQKHLAFLRQNIEAGRFLLAGPLTDDGYIRGLILVASASTEDARSLMAGDPAVQAGRFSIEAHPLLWPEIGSALVKYAGSAEDSHV
jgi:uncharacterized protein YciI